MKKNYFLVVLMVTLFSIENVKAQDPYIGEIRIFAGNFAPRGWAFCDGQTLSIAQNAALFSLLGVTYGGNGTTTFSLPDLRGRVPVHVGTGNGLPPVVEGEMGGNASTTLTLSNLPAHSHQIAASTAAGTTSVPTNAVMANTSTLDKEYTTTSNTTMSPTGSVGSNQPFENRQPYLGLNYIIALEGIYPSRP